MNALLDIEQVRIVYGKTTAVHDVSLKLAEGKIGCLLGPSGCGKTTLLRAIAGFDPIVAGAIRLDGIDVSTPQYQRSPEKRRVGMVFQDYALFPHLSIQDNIAFGIRSLPTEQRHARVHELLELVGLPEYCNFYPHQLSGGQQQRIALARAIAPRPRLLLLDEPFSSMDIELREGLAREVRKILKHEKITALLVTHDQNEAFAMADEIGVMNAGYLQQWDTSYRLYHEPSNRFVADFIGHGILLSGTVLNAQQVKTELALISGHTPTHYEPGCQVEVLVRPDDILHDDDSPMRAEVLDKAFRGAHFLYTLRLNSGAKVLCLIPSHHDHAIGEHIGIRLEIDHLVIFRKQAQTGVGESNN